MLKLARLSPCFCALSALFALTLFASLGACSSSDDGNDKDKSNTDAGDDKPSNTQALAVSCDWLHHTLSIVDEAKLTDGATRADALVAEIDLSMYPAGPLDARIVPGTHLAIVSLSAGFFSIPGAGSLLVGAATIPSDPGKLLFVDLDKRKVLGELVTGQQPMGIAITKDNQRAFIAHFGSNDIVEIDIDKRSILHSVMVGIYSEEITLDETGEVGIFSYSAAGNVRTFGSADFAGTLSAEVTLTGDAAGVTFFPGTKIAYVVQSPNPLTSAKGGHTLVDVSDPKNPVVLEDIHTDDAPVAYPATADKARKSVLVPVVANGMLQLQELVLDASNKPMVKQTIEAGSSGLFGAYSVSLDAKGRALLAIPSMHAVAVVDLAAATSVRVAWGIDEAGPTDIIALP